MAVWQYPLTVLPRLGVLNRLGHVPEQLFIDHAGWRQFWASLPGDGSLPEPAFEDARTIDWWADAAVPAAPLAAAVDQLLPRSSWSSADNLSWKGDEDHHQDHDCSLSVTADCVTEFEFRTDLRNLGSARAFLTAMLGLCQQHDLLVMDTRGQLMPPALPALLPSLEQSGAVRFLTNPHEFLAQALRPSDHA